TRAWPQSARGISMGRIGLGLALTGPFCVAVEAPGAALVRDAPPGAALVSRAHLRPQLHLLKAAAAALAQFVALAGRADGDAGGVRRGLIPVHPGLMSLGRHGMLVTKALPVIDHQGVHLGKRLDRKSTR